MRTLLLLLFAVNAVQAADLTGVVRDAADHKPIRTAHVYVYAALPMRADVPTVCAWCHPECVRHQAVAADGSFRIPVDPFYLYQVLAVAPGYEPKIESIPRGIYLDARRPADEASLIRGRVTDADGKPLLGATVAPIRVYFDDGATERPKTKETLTDPDGTFVLRLPSDGGVAFDVQVRAHDFAPTIAFDITPMRPRTVNLLRGVAVCGRVVRNGTPVGGAIVRFEPRHELGQEEIGTDDDGNFLVTGLGTFEEYKVSIKGLYLPLRIAKTGEDGSSIEIGTIDIARP